MPVITKISEQNRRPNRRNVHLDGRFAFGCNVNVIAKFRLREGMSLTDEQVKQIEEGEVRQECFDKAMEYLGTRLHSRSELERKLARREYGPAIVAAVLENLAQLGYVNDERFARTKALSAAEHKKHGSRRAMVELLKSGVQRDAAQQAIHDVYDAQDTLGIVRALARKQAPRLRKLDGLVARRRLAGMLMRRGFDYDEIRPVLDELLRGELDDPK
jgi:regulatory protein